MDQLQGIKGLSKIEVVASAKLHGANSVNYKKESRFISSIKSIIAEPMVLLLLATSLLYFFTKNYQDSIFLAVSILLVAAISIFQDNRSRNALNKLKELTKPYSKVVRDGYLITIETVDIVLDDVILIEEGGLIPADALLIRSNDFTVNESILTGEAFSIVKSINDDNAIYQGTLATSGTAFAKVIAIGKNTRLGKIGKSLEEIDEVKTPLEQQIHSFIIKMVIAGGIVFIAVWLINFFRYDDIYGSFIKALTLAMSILPEEIPVAFSTFMALGAWRLMRSGIIVKQMKTVETLGSATVICTDKTGTITENKMELHAVYALKSNSIKRDFSQLNENEIHVVETAMWASEIIPFDPMEKALHKTYQKTVKDKDIRHEYKMIHEYPLEGKPPFMTHIYQNNKEEIIIAAKGAPEAFFGLCNLSQEHSDMIKDTIQLFSAEGLRVLAVASVRNKPKEFPEKQTDFNFELIGLVAFQDPPKKNIAEVLEKFYEAGIGVKIITGDNELTSKAIAKSIGLRGYQNSISGDELMQLNESELQQKAVTCQVFTRMFPEAKLRVINALMKQNEVVAMTGDGVNDGPALKAAHIGIAMGRGSETAKQAAALILADDDLGRMADAVAMGRKIYTNLKKAIQYIISIHIPIILTVFIPLALGWLYPAIFTPVHVIFLELIMGPTCSIIYENEPQERNAMSLPPRPSSSSFFSWKELSRSIVQGLMITAGTLGIYIYAVKNGMNENQTRTLVFITLITANVFLTLINRSFYYSFIESFKNKNRLIPLIISLTILLVVLLLKVPILQSFFKFEDCSGTFIFIAILAGFTSTIWIEIHKLYIRYILASDKPSQTRML